MQRTKYISLTLSLLFITLGQVAAKASFSLLGCNYATVNLTYESVDTHNNPITLTAVLYYPTSSGTSVNNIKSCNYIFLNNHATITDNASSPSGGQSAMGQLYWMTTDNALVVNPDYLGFGGTRNEKHPYMAMTLTARNVVDCMKAAIADAQQRNKLAANYYTINCGYSQGGGVTMAVARYLETEADKATQQLINLRGSICGAGCYGQTLILDDYEKRTSIEYPIFLPYALQGMKETYGEDCMKDINLEDCFTEKFWNSGILETLNAKETDVDALNAKLKAVFGGSCSFYDIISETYRDHSSALYKAVRKALKKNDVYDGWVPQHPITFYHYTSDEVVPYLNTTVAIEAFNSAGCKVELVLKKAEEMTDYGSWNVAKLKYNNLQQNHRDYGTCFYLLVFDGQLTPAAATDGYISTQAQSGVDRNEMECKLNEGEWSLVSFPSEVDGYYFGANAERYAVTKKANKNDHYIVNLKAMDDLADFEAGKDYLVRPTLDIDKVVSVTAGLLTPKTEAEPFVTNQLATQANLTTVGNSAYATLYSAFDVTIPQGVKAYTAHLEDNKMQLEELTQGIIPAQTGVVLKAQQDGEILMEYNTTGTAIETSELQGTLTEITKPNNVVLTLGTNSVGTIGFYRYTGTLAANKAYYQMEGGSEVKAFGIRFPEDNETDGIEGTVASDDIEGMFSLSGIHTAQPHRGLNLIRTTSGKVKKVMVK